MTGDEDIRRQLEEIRRSQQEFITEWRTASEDARQKEEALQEERSRLKAESAARQKEYRFQLAIVFVFVALLAWQVYRSSSQSHPLPQAAGQSK